jgi:hypothetical protein
VRVENDDLPTSKAEQQLSEVFGGDGYHHLQTLATAEQANETSSNQPRTS